MWRREDLVWAAGLFEGEGCITMSEGLPYLSLKLTDYDVIRRFHLVTKLGRLYGPYPPCGLGSKVYWMWKTSSTCNSYALICALYTWLGKRRRGRAREVFLPDG